MNILFLSLGVFNDLSEGSVHIDIIRRFAEDHDVWLACKNEGQDTKLTNEMGINVLRVRTGALKKVGIIKKGINTIMAESQFKEAIKEYLKDVKFDLVIYTTPPITFASAVRYIKERDGATTYLMLKDIFPQNAVDLEMMSKKGAKGLIYKFFRRKEKELYSLSDYIGCMSPANQKYVLKHNPEINPEIVEECPNSTIIEDMSVDEQIRNAIRDRYDIPKNKNVFVYGGNLGKPQGIPFLVECLKTCKNNNEAFFLIVGQGTEFDFIKQSLQKEQIENCKLLAHIPKREFEKLVAACDVGMIFLDHRFTIPNFPSRLLSYMKAKLPVLAITDSNTDLGSIIESGRFGWWCESNYVELFEKTVESINKLSKSDLKQAGERAWGYMKVNYSVDRVYTIIMNKLV